MYDIYAWRGCAAQFGSPRLTEARRACIIKRMENLFEMGAQASKPLAERMRPASLDDFFGQKHIVGEGTLLRRAIKTDTLGSCIFYGPPGCGKTTLANIIAATTGGAFVKLNAVSSGVADAKKVIDDAKRRRLIDGVKTYLLLDECHRWNKAQSDCVLSAIEEGYIIFIGSTTENPYIAMTKAIVSRCRIFEFRKLEKREMQDAICRALSDKKNGLGNYNVKLEKDALDHLIWASDGDVRTALNALELAFLTTAADKDGVVRIDLKTAEQSIQKKSLSVDENMYYDMLSAFCKSLRGSDSDAALYWAERLMAAGCDPMLILRRLVVHASEDVGMADPQALVIATSAMYAFEHIGMPEGKIPLCNAIIYVCEASKSPSVVQAMERASEAVARVKDDNVPPHLRDTHYGGVHAGGYKYPHDFGGWVEQQYLPDKLKDAEFYTPSANGYEKLLVRAKKIKKNKG